MANPNNRYFQWVVTEKRGQICIFDHIDSEDGNIYIVFKDGSRINEQLVAQINQRDLTGKFMAEIDHPSNCWQFKERANQTEQERIEQDANSGERFEIPSVEDFVSADINGQSGVTRPQKKPKNKIIDLIPPQRTPPSHSVFGAIRNSMNVVTQPTVIEVINPVGTTQIPLPKEKSIDDSDPVYILLSKSKKSEVEVSMNITISLPPKSLYDIAKENFDDGAEKFIEYIVKELSSDEIKNALKNAITEMYEQKDV